MATKKNDETDKYADFRYEIVTPEELRESKWLIEQGIFKDMEDYITFVTRMEINIMKRADAKKKKALEKRRLAAARRRKAA